MARLLKSKRVRAVFAGLVAVVVALGIRSGVVPREDTTLKILTWSQYLPPEFLERFTAETGVRVEVSVFSSNEELFAKLRAGATGYDILQPSDYLVDRLIRLKMIVPLKPELVPNRANVAEHLHDVPYDPGLKYSMPFLEGTTGLIVNRRRITVPESEISWAHLFDSPDPRNTYLLDDMREVFAAALLWKGKNPNELDEEATRLASETLVAAKDNFVSFNSEPVAIIQRTEITIAHAFSYQAAEAERIHPYLKYVLPKEGAVHWVDTMVIPTTSKKQALAHRFINFVMDNGQNEFLRSLNGFPSVLKADPAKREETLRKARFYFQDLNPKSFIRIGKAWTEIKTG